MKRRMMSSIVPVPSDEKFYEVCVMYDVNTDKVKVNKWRIFAFEYKTVVEPDTGMTLRFLEPISITVYRTPPSGFKAIMDTEGTIRTNTATFRDIDDFIQDIRNKNKVS